MPALREGAFTTLRSRRLRFGARLWLGACFALLLFPLASWLRIPAGYRLVLPDTPFDGIDPRKTEEWAFLWLARDLVPRGASYTVVARDAGTEMNLFMMALGILPDRLPLPTSYFGNRQPEGARARYVLAFGCSPPDEPGLVRVGRRLRGGCVFRREEKGRP